MDFKEYNLSIFSIRFFKQNFARLLDESDDELRYALIIAIYRYMVEAEKDGNIKMKGENFSISMQSDKALMDKVETAAAVMVCADGRVEPSEITVAEEKGKKLINHFNSLEFRELCLSPENLPKPKDLSKSINDLFKEDDINKLTDFLKDIATSDVTISSEESAFIKTFVK